MLWLLMIWVLLSVPVAVVLGSGLQVADARLPGRLGSTPAGGPADGCTPDGAQEDEQLVGAGVGAPTV